VRYPRGSGPGAVIEADLDTLDIGKGLLRRQGREVALLAFGTMVAPALKAADELNATVVDMRFVKPLDVELVTQLASTHTLIVTIEEGSVMGGAGSAVSEALSAAGFVKQVLQLGLPDQFIDHGDAQQLLAQCGLDAAGIVKSVRQRLGSKEPRLVANS
jgi:1-deoxy-D-xylulose-5-phosphate synthase